MQLRTPQKKLFSSAARSLALFLLAGALLLTAADAVAKQRIEASFLYSLSNFSGPIPFMQAKLFVDTATGETYVLDPSTGAVSIFNATGMEVYRFGDDGSLGSILALAVEPDGRMLVLSRLQGEAALIRCNYKGQPLGRVAVDRLPPRLQGFAADRMVYRDGRVYLLDSEALQVVQLDVDGTFGRDFDLAAAAHIGADQLANTEIGGFNVDGEGNLLFTVPVRFCAYTLSPDGQISSFGEAGGAPGKFAIVGDIAADNAGNYYVADRLRHVVLIFDKDRQFQAEFGYRGLRPENLIGPQHIGLDAKGRLYVSQLRNRGVSVFEINFR